MKDKTVWLVIGFLGLLLVAGGVFFVKTGGMGLYRIVVNYLIPSISDKKYSWLDFIDRGTDKSISGFYAGGNNNGFRLWTLSGLKTFRHKPGTSLYHFADVCKILKTMESNQETSTDQNTSTESSWVEGEFVPMIVKWETWVKMENFVSVTRVKGTDGKEYVDKAMAMSGKYKILGRIEEDTCN